MVIVSQIWRPKAFKTREQAFCSDVSKALCREDFRVSFESVECHSTGWLPSRQGDQSCPSIFE